jgi:hypothetical protein
MMARTLIHTFSATPALMLVINNSPITFQVVGSAAQQNIEISTNDTKRFQQEIDITQKTGVTALAVLVKSNPKYNVITSGTVQGMCIGDNQDVTQHFDGNVMKTQATTDLYVVINVPDNINISVYNAINIDITGVKGIID